MQVLLKGRAAFQVKEIDASEGQAVQVSIGGQDPMGNSSLVTDFRVHQAENISVSQCLNGGVYLYTFGHDPNRSEFSLTITTFLNMCDDSNKGADLAKAVDAYNKGRVSVSKAISSLTVGSTLFRGYLIGQGIAVADPEVGMLNTTYDFIALDTQGGK